MKKCFPLLTLSLLLIYQIGFSQAPPNDLCTTAEILPVYSIACGGWTIGNNTGATNSGELPTPTCGSYQGGDFWYEITIPAPGNISFNYQNLNWSSPGGALYSGTCGNLIQVNCTQFISGWPFVFTNLTPGVYYLRIWDFGNNQFGTIDLCATTPPPPPTNDNCAIAEPATVNPDQLCAVTVSGTTHDATLSISIRRHTRL